MDDEKLAQFINDNERILNNIAGFMFKHSLYEMVLQDSPGSPGKVVLSFVFQE